MFDGHLELEVKKRHSPAVPSFCVEIFFLRKLRLAKTLAFQLAPLLRLRWVVIIA